MEYRETEGRLSGDIESQRLEEDASRARNWKRWGPYLSERQWGTVREDYSDNGEAWNYFTHNQSSSRAYRWGEDGLLGLTDRECRLCFALALWNGKDPILKERLFGLTNPEANHGEDVKEAYFYLESTPTHSYMKSLYKYPQAEFPYQQLLDENQRRSKQEREFELLDTGIFDESRYFDVFVEYAKGSPNDILIKITIANRGPDPSPIHILPTLWARNTWSWGCDHEGCWIRPDIRLDPSFEGGQRVLAKHAKLEPFILEAETLSRKGSESEDVCQFLQNEPQWLFTENETNKQKLYGVQNDRPYVKDAFHDYVIQGKHDAVNPKQQGSKLAAYHKLLIPGNTTATLKMRFYSVDEAPLETFGSSFDEIFAQRMAEKDEFYRARLPVGLSSDEYNLMIQAYAGLLHTKQFYHYTIRDWLQGDPELTPPPPSRASKGSRNVEWGHFFARDVILVCDKWEYPWPAVWDLAFHCVAVSTVDVELAKQQLLLFLREWYMHPNGCLPAYEWNFSDVNPPLHAWACWEVYKRSGDSRKTRDSTWLAKCFLKLIINFTWWVNRKDIDGRHIFSGGFLGLDNIGVFDRSSPLPTGGHIEQADGTAWMAFYSLMMLNIAMELAASDPVYESMASKFFEHFISIADAMNHFDGSGLWDEKDGFYYDHLKVGEQSIPLRVRSLVGVVPLFATCNISESLVNQLSGFRKRADWFITERKDMAKQISFFRPQSESVRAQIQKEDYSFQLSIPNRERLEKVLQYLFDENEFLSPYGIRSLSKFHESTPYTFECDGQQHQVAYLPGESDSGLFGGNSNWRGPIWFPMNFLLVESLFELHTCYGNDLLVEFPTGSGNKVSLATAAAALSSRLTKIFLPQEDGVRPCHGKAHLFANDPHWKNLILFYEYFHGDSGEGLGASHQTGWTALVANHLVSSRYKQL